MKVVPFTIPVAKEHSIIVQEDLLPYFYNYLHRHNEIQITWVIAGEGTLIAGNYMHPFKADDIFIIGSNQPHIFKSDASYFNARSKQQVQALTIFFHPKGLLSALLSLPEMGSVRKFIQTTDFGLQVPATLRKKIADDMLKVKNMEASLRLAAFIQLLHQLSSIKDYHLLSTITDDLHISDTEGLRMNDIYQYTMGNYAENITLAQVSSVAHLTPQAFCRYFKKHTRKTYLTFLNEIRINEAAKKIVSGNFESISSVAYQCGFVHVANFNRVFKKVTGKSPKQYLKEYRHKVN
ncbi:MAG: AraC family transcriptional regulator [Chitinophagaceae bacterium]